MDAHVVVEVDSAALHALDVERVATVLRDLPNDDQIHDLADIFTLLGDPGRLRLLTSLLVGGELCVSDLALLSGLSESATSHALRLLRAHGVVRARRVGRQMRYCLRDNHVRLLLTTALEHVDHDHG